jgi:PhnB protein
MRLNPYLTFDGQCESAFKFYEQCLRGKIVMLMRYGESPLAAQTPLRWHQRVIHATFSWGEHILQGADALPETYRKPPRDSR